MKHRNRIVAASIAIGVLALAACSSNTASSVGTSASGAPDYSGQTLNVLQYEGAESAMLKGWQAAADALEKETGATVNLTTTSFEDINSTASQLLNSSDAPDVMEYNKGNATAGQLAQLDLIQNLNDAYAQYGWDTKLGAGLQTTTKYSADGIMGSGDYYGLPDYGEFVFLYYNTDAFAKYNIAVPTTVAELESAMQTFVDNGITPMATSAQEYPLGQLWYQLALSKASRSFVEDYELYTNPVDWNGPEISYATTTVSDWVDKGYISKSASGLTAEDAGVSFINGDVPIFYSGSWWYGRMLTDVTSFKLGIMNFPGTTLTPGSAGNMWVIPTKSKQPELATLFMDVTMRPEIQAIIGNQGGLPVAANVADVTDPNAQALIALFNEVNNRDGLAFYPDWPTPTFYGDLNAALQGLVNGTLTPAATQKQLGDDYTSYVSTLG